jgi:hypothetical protein
MRIMNRTILLLLVLVGLSSCYPGGAEYYDELDLVYTSYTKDANFQSFKTYARPDSIPKIGSGDIFDPDNNDLPEFVNQATANIIFAQIDANMKAYGYTKGANSGNADIVLLTTAGQNTDIYYYYNNWYWGWYGWYGGWYYPGYYPPSYTSVTTGGLMINYTVPRDSTIDGSVPIYWTAVMSGLLEGSSSGANSRIKKGIDQAFKQSSYIKQ